MYHDLKACPFCGSDKIKTRYSYREYKVKEQYAESQTVCENCHACGPRVKVMASEIMDGVFAPDEARKRWNQRRRPERMTTSR